MEFIPIHQITKFFPYKIQGTHVHYSDRVGEFILDTMVLSDSTKQFIIGWRPTWMDTEPRRKIEVKPIVRPLTDLAKEIQLSDGSYITPIGLIFHDYRKELEIKWQLNHKGELIDLWLDYKDSEGKDYAQKSSFNMESLEILYALHFDVFGWVAAGHAHDINGLDISLNTAEAEKLIE